MSRTARSNPALTAAICAGVAVGGPSSGDQRNAPSTTSTARPTARPIRRANPVGPSTTSVSRPSSIQPSVSSTPSASRRHRRGRRRRRSTTSPAPTAAGASARTPPPRPPGRPVPSTPSPPPTPARTRTRRSASVNDVSSCNSRSRSSRPTGLSHGAPNRERSTANDKASSPRAAITDSRSFASLARTIPPMMPQTRSRAHQSGPASSTVHRRPPDRVSEHADSRERQSSVSMYSPNSSRRPAPGSKLRRPWRIRRLSKTITSPGRRRTTTWAASLHARSRRSGRARRRRHRRSRPARRAAPSAALW